MPSPAPPRTPLARGERAPSGPGYARLPPRPAAAPPRARSPAPAPAGHSQLRQVLCGRQAAEALQGPRPGAAQPRGAVRAADIGAGRGARGRQHQPGQQAAARHRRPAVSAPLPARFAPQHRAGPAAVRALPAAAAGPPPTRAPAALKTRPPGRGGARGPPRPALPPLAPPPPRLCSDPRRPPPLSEDPAPLLPQTPSLALEGMPQRCLPGWARGRERDALFPAAGGSRL